MLITLVPAQPRRKVNMIVNQEPIDPRRHLIVALDVTDHRQAIRWIQQLGDLVTFYKIGLELLASGDYFHVLDALAKHDKRIFVDLKFFDIPNTIAKAVQGLSRWPIHYCTIHSWHSAMMDAAVQACSGQMRLLAVTVLTSMTESDLSQMGLTRPTIDIVRERALAAQACGMAGVVASGQEARTIRQAVGPHFTIVCPGIRAVSHDQDDQQRTVTVEEAFRNGANAIVVGRPIRLASDPSAMVKAIGDNIAHALSNKHTQADQ